MARPRGTRRVLAAVAVLLLLALLVPPFINLRRFHREVSRALADALGRPVSVGDIHPRLLPQPGFDLENFAVADDPAFSAEPLLRADTVTAYLRLTSLWRGRLEISTISLKDASFNLVRSQDGQWNVAFLLARAAQTPAAPTSSARPQARPRFPYIEAENAQVNLKLGTEKTVYALREADFALWLASEYEWRMRLEARPVRTDASLSDTGTLRLEARVPRGPGQRPELLQVQLALEKAQLGQFTKLLLGRDLGWRGTLSADADVAGTPGNLTLSLRATLSDFRRYDIVTTDSLQWRALCAASYRAVGAVLSGIECHLPLDPGEVAVRGGVADLFGSPRYDLSIAATDLPGSALTALARHAKKGLPADLTGSADLDAALTLRTPDSSPGAAPQWQGGGSIEGLALRSRALGPELKLGRVAFALLNPEVTPGKGSPAAGARVVVLPFAFPLGAPRAGIASGWLSAEAYRLGVQGDADLARLLQLARGLGLQPPALNASGDVKMDLDLDGRWADFAAPSVTGQAQVRNVTARMTGVAAPLHVASAALLLAPGQVSVQKLDADLAGISFSGSLELARDCDPLASCAARFDLHAATLSLDVLNRLLNPQFRPRTWFGLGAPATPESNLDHIRAQGHLAVDRLLLKSVAATRVEAQVQIAAGRMDVTGLGADILGGRHRGEWHADFTGRAPTYFGSGSLDQLSLPQITAVMHDPWATGWAGGTYRLTTSGWTATELAASLAGSLDFDGRAGVLRHLVLGSARDAVRFQRISGHAVLRDRTFTLSDCSLETPQGRYTLSGTASFSRQLDLQLARPRGPAYSVTGSLARPRVTPLQAPETQAALKP